MRILQEMSPDETIVSQGRYEYQQDGAPTGQLETWQISQRSDGAEIVRADVDARSIGRASLLTHFVRLPDGRPEVLRMRFGTDTERAAAEYQFEPDMVQVARQSTGYPRRYDKLDMASNYQVDYHAVIAHDYPWRGYPEHAQGQSWAIPIFSPDLWAEGEDQLIGRSLRFTIGPGEPTDWETPAGFFAGARHFKITMDDGTEAAGWYDMAGIPIEWVYPTKGLSFKLIGYKQYQATAPD
ncbi:MAG: hypothetical protein GYB68_02845 [Chloroflexi bacterium]|nr:hypothetical protein [Chloroflexota bacterium]